MAIDVFNPAGSLIDNINRSSRFTDYLSNYNFHVMDVSFSVPTVFSLSAGFRFCTAPEITVQTKEFKEGTFEYTRKIATGATAGDIVFHRGVSFFNSDFYDWISSYVRGEVDQRKNLLIIQYGDIDTGAGASQNNPAFFGFQSITSLVKKVPARAWLLVDCIPIHYKSGTDFDAIGSDISISELTVSPLYFEEFNMGL
jgi:phage tail-like protein